MDDFQESMARLVALIFPGGQKQVDEEVMEISAIVNGRLPMETTRDLLWRTKVRLKLADNRSERSIVEAILLREEDIITSSEASLIYRYLTGLSKLDTTKGDGSTKETAIIVNANSSATGIPIEYAYIESVCGARGTDWNVEIQALLDKDPGKRYDLIVVKLKDGTSKDFFFDISNFFQHRDI